MLHAVFSDIHGNLPALEAAIADAKAHGALSFLFIGDYFRDFPWPNEVADTIRSLDVKTAVKGNNERYIETLLKRGQAEKPVGQMSLIDWNFSLLAPEAIDFFRSLPDEETICDEGAAIRLEHISGIFSRAPKIGLFTSSGFRRAMEAKKFTHGEYLANAREALLGDSGAAADLDGLPDGIYLFGHNHLQFHMRHGGKLFINPGSCGLALDYDQTAAYALLDVRSKDEFYVTERRVKYDYISAASAVKNSSLALRSPVWRDLVVKTLLGASECMTSLLVLAAEEAKRRGKTCWPVDDETWEAAASRWRQNELANG